MKKKILSFSLVVFIGVGLFFVNPHKKIQLLSPVLGNAKIKMSENLWFPQESSASPTLNDVAAPISAKAYFFVEANSGKVLFEKLPHDKLPIASLAKIMTAIITLENKSWSDKFLVSKRAADMEPDKMLLIPQETLTTEELMQGLFLVSANDAAEVFAEGVTGSRDEFIELMNKKALQLGMKNTLFLNPSGLDEDNKIQYSSAYDVALMARYAIRKWPKLIDITSSNHIYIPANNTHQDYDLYSGINLLTTYPGVVGFKTGFTPEAGLTLVTAARRDGKEILGVLLGSTNRRDDARALLDMSFNIFKQN